MIWCDW